MVLIALVSVWKVTYRWRLLGKARVVVNGYLPNNTSLFCFDEESDDARFKIHAIMLRSTLVKWHDCIKHTKFTFKHFFILHCFTGAKNGHKSSNRWKWSRSHICPTSNDQPFEQVCTFSAPCKPSLSSNLSKFHVNVVHPAESFEILFSEALGIGNSSGGSRGAIGRSPPLKPTK